MFLVTLLTFLLVALAALLFLAGIIGAGLCSLHKKPETMPSFLTHATTVIGGILSTNLGAVLGLSIEQSNRLSAFNIQTLTAPSEWIQVLAACLYVFGLLTAFGFWAVTRFSEKPYEVVRTLPDLTKTLLGVACGALAVMLGVSQ